MRSSCSIIVFLSCTLSVLAQNQENSNQASITAVAAPAPGKLEVRWVNPGNTNGKLLSSTAVARSTDGGSEVNCNGNIEAISPANCSLNGLRNFTEYEVWVVVCTAPPQDTTDSMETETGEVPTGLQQEITIRQDVYIETTEDSIERRGNYIGRGDVYNEPLKDEVKGEATGGGCTNSSVKTKWTIPTAPHPANITAVAALAAGTLEVRWLNPNNSNGELLSSTAVARSTDGGSEVNCSGTAEASSATKCSLNGLRNFAQYEVWVVVCTAPANEEVEGEATGGGCTNSSVKTKWTIPTAPHPANITAVAALAAGTLEVRWLNPNNSNGELLSSTAVARSTDGGSEVNCSGTAEASSATKCSLNGLRNFAEYEVWVVVCTAPANEEVKGEATGGGCTNSSVKTKWTIPTAPHPANITAVAALAAGTLEVRWLNPNNSNGELLSSTAVARSTDGGSEVNCSGTAEASSATKCSLNGLRNFAEYEVWVVVCTAPANEEVKGEATGGGCTNSSVKTKWTIPTAPHPANITAVAALAAGTLEVRWLNPNNSNGELLSSTAVARSTDGGSEVNCSGTAEASSATKCSLNGLRNFAEYEVWVVVCTAPANEEVKGEATGGGCTNSSVKTKWTIPTAPHPANITAVAALAAGTLEVRWLNPNNSNGELLSSTAVARSTDGGSEVNCSGTAEASSATKCSLNGLRNFAEYEVWVVVCTAPANEEVKGEATGGGCTNSSVKTKWTIPTAPHPANITAVAALAAGTLEVRWLNPNNSNGELLSSTAVARSTDGGSEVNCSGTAEASSATKCSLNGLRNFAEYEVWVVVCTAPANEEVEGEATGGGCTNSSFVSNRTLSGVFEPQQLAALSKEIPKSNKTLSDPLTQISIKVALSTLPVEDVGPVSIVTAYIELVSSNSSQSLSRRRPLSSNSPFLYGSYDSTTWAPWEVVILNNSQGVHRRLNDTFFTIGDSSSEQTCDHCYNGPLSSGTKYRIRLIVYTETGAGETGLHEMSTSPKPDPIPIGLIVGVVVGCLLLLAVVAFVVFWMRCRRVASSDDEKDKQRVHIVYEPHPEPRLDRSKIPPPIRFEDFDAHIKKLQSDADLLQEFRTLDELTKQEAGDYGLTAEMAALVPELNRYADMTPYDQNIVRLDRNWSMYCGDQQPMGPLVSQMQAVYINANYVKACQYNVQGQAEVAPRSSQPKYIATQGPLTHTAADFLYMVHQQRVPVVIMLCNIQEGGKPKCAQYWPDAKGLPEERSSLTRTVTVTLQQVESSPSMVTRTLTVQPEGESESWTFTQLHFLAWADHAVPDLDEFYDLLQTYSRLRGQKPFSEAFGSTIVHCSAGVGRTGTLVCADILLDQLRKNPATIDVFGTVLASRVFRRRFVQVKEQLRFLYEFLAYCIAKEGHTANAAALRPAPEMTPNAPAEYMNLPVGNEYMNVRDSTSALPPVIRSKAPPPTSAAPVVPRVANSVALTGVRDLPQRPLPNVASGAQPSTLGQRPLMPRRPVSSGTTSLQVPVNAQNGRTTLPAPPSLGPYEF
ncbi:hypothetical protein AAHC03_023036 [Spirometra sp. Aus1]